MTSYLSTSNRVGFLFGLLSITLLFSLVSYWQLEGWPSCLEGIPYAVHIWLGGISLFALIIWHWLISKPKLITENPVLRIRYHVTLLVIVALHCYVVLWSALVLAQQDSYWFATQLGVATPPPATRLIKLLSTPLYLTLGVSAYLYARGHILEYANTVPIRFVIFVLAPLIIEPSQGHETWAADQSVYGALFRINYWVIVAIWLGLGLYPIVSFSVQKIIYLASTAQDGEKTKHGDR